MIFITSWEIALGGYPKNEWIQWMWRLDNQLSKWKYCEQVGEN